MDDQQLPGGPYDLVVVGGGTAGTSAASHARRLGARVALVVRTRPDDSRCDAHLAMHALRQAAQRAFQTAERPPDFLAVIEWGRGICRQLGPAAAIRTLRNSDVDVYLGQAAFAGRHSLEIEGRRLQFHRALIAAGARAAPAAIDGAGQVDCLTGETVLGLEALPRRLAVIGTGPRACEWAQIFRCFGSDVHLVGRRRTILPDEDTDAVATDAVAVVRTRLENESIRLHLNCDHFALETTGTASSVIIERKGHKEKLFVDRVLLDTPRLPDTTALNLDTAGVAYTERGIVVSSRLQTTNRRIFAAGEICGAELASPHAARATARLAVQNALGRGRGKLDRLAIARCVNTDPEIVCLGLTPAEAAKHGFDTVTYRGEWSGVDAAVLGRRVEGFAAVHVERSTGRILGATVVANDAAELIGPLSLLIARRLTPAALSDIIPCRPSRLEVLSQIADRWADAHEPSHWLDKLAKWPARWKLSRCSTLAAGEPDR